MQTGFEIRSLSLNALSDIVPIHCASFPNSALSKFGMETVRRYYEWQMIGPHDYHKYGVYDNEKLVGYCISGVSSLAMTGFLKRNLFFLIFQGIRHLDWFILDPLTRSRLILGMQALLFPSSQRRKARPGVRQARILVIATNPKQQGRGIGRILLENAEAKAFASGYSQLGLTVHIDNEKAIGFYKHLGWKKEPDNENWSGQMIKTISLS